jgi:hypothetical protein
MKRPRALLASPVVLGEASFGRITGKREVIRRERRDENWSPENLLFER